MHNNLSRDKAIIITGGQGSGKSTLANIIADHFGKTKTIIDGSMLDSNFGLSFLADNVPDTVIVEDFYNWLKAKQLVSNEFIRVDVKGKDPVTVEAPNFIFTTGDKDVLNLPDDSRRFFIIDIKE